MYIGKLNAHLAEIPYTVTKKNSRAVPATLEGGNPFLGETLTAGWKELIDSGLDVHVQLPEGTLLNTVVLRIGQNSDLSGVRLYDGAKQMLLSSYCAETGKHITEKELALSVDEILSDFVLEICGEFTDITLDGIDLYGAKLDGLQLFPTPDRLEESLGSLAAAAIQTCSGSCDIARSALPILQEKFKEITGISLLPAKDGQISLELDAAIPEGGYRLSVSAQGIRICASDLRGFVMGSETLLKLFREVSFPVCTVEDAPFVPFRGVHLYLPAKADIPFTKRLIKYILSPCGYNTIILEMGAGMRFDSHPEINEAFLEAAQKTASGQWPPLPHHEVAGGQLLEKEDVRDLVAYAGSFGIEVIPEIQSLSHIQYLTLAHPDIAELPADGITLRAADARLEDIPPSDFYAHSACPSNPKSWQIVFDLIDEIVDVVQPARYVHMGHDEVYQIGICPICSKADPAELFARDVIRYHDYLAGKGLKMMIWADMLQPIGENNQPKVTTRAVSMLPKDIVLLDFIWYFHPDKDIEENLLPYGYQVIYGNLYSSHFPRYETRIRKDGILGGQISAWVGTREEDLAREGKLYDFLLTAQMLWSKDYCRHSRYAYDSLIRSRIPQLRSCLQDVRYPSMDAHIREAEIYLAEPFCPARSGEHCFPAGCKAESLAFLHAASNPQRRLPWVDLEQIGTYLVTYEDGSEAQIPITYTGNIHHWNRRQNAPFANMFYRHNGYTGVSWYCDGIESRLSDGRICCLYRYEWRNPHPDRKITQIRLIPEKDAETQILVQRITAIQ